MKKHVLETSLDVVNNPCAATQLKDLSCLAYDLFSRGKSLTVQQIQFAINLFDSLFGHKDTNGFLNLCLSTFEKYKEKNVGSLCMAVTETIATNMKNYAKELIQ